MTANEPLRLAFVCDKGMNGIIAVTAVEGTLGSAALTKDVGIGSGGNDEQRENLELVRHDSALV